MASPLAAQPDDGFGPLELGDTTTALLGGHLLVRLPASAVVAARPYGLMGAPEPTERETRAVIDVAARRFVLFARELNRTVPDDFPGAAALAFAPYQRAYGPFRIEEVVAPDARLRTVLVRPEETDPTREAVALRWVLVANGDRTVQEVGFYVNPAGATDLAAAESLAVRISSTLRPGPRQEQAGGHRVELARGEQGALLLDVPPGTLYSLQEGPDFLVHHVDLLVPLGLEGGSLGLYDGSHPNVSDGEGVEAPAEVLGHAVTWRLQEEHGEVETVYRADLVLAHPLFEGSYLHLFVSAGSPEDRDRLMDTAAALRVSPGR